MLQEQYIQKYTYSDYLHWEGAWELINGYPYAMSPAPVPKHQKAGNNINFNFTEALRKNKHACDCDLLYESDWIINQDTVVKPDSMIVCGKYDQNKAIQFPPSLIVEIFSPSTRLKDRNTKFNLYEQMGVKYYLMVDTDKKSIEYYQLLNNKYTQQENLLLYQFSETCKIEVSLSNIFTA